MSETDEGGWQKWVGGRCPVAPGEVVSFKRRSGELVESVDHAEDFNWGRYLDPVPTDIIAYRLDPLPSPLIAIQAETKL